MVTVERQAAKRGNCCMASALEDMEATFCIQCGKPLLRCMAFAECGGIVDDSGMCPVCVQPQLHLDQGASLSAAVGGSVVVPIELVNGSHVDRPLFVRRLWSREKGGWREERLGWERLRPGESAQASVTACEFVTHGLHEIEIMWEVATQWLSREERFAFSARVQLEIADPAKVKQGDNINITAANGNVIEVRSREGDGGGVERTVQRLAMKVRRVERTEREQGLRGIDADTVMPRSARFELLGFAAGHVLAASRPIVTPDAMLHFGRAYLRGAGGEGDVRLLLQTRDGKLDEEASAFISRRHFDIYVENERPVLRVASNNGVRVNGKAHGVDRLVQLADGDVIAPLVADPAAVELRVRFRHELNRISAIELTRVPAWREAAAEGASQ